MVLELMDEFFAARADGYEEHMLNNVEGCRDGYVKMAKAVKDIAAQYKRPLRLLDLGCGTGLELDEIFKLMPQTTVIGIDLTKDMLKKCKEKHGDKDIKLICGNYFDVDLGSNSFDCAVSFQTMHHFAPQKKIQLYNKINRALTICGVYIECDYMVEDQAEEDFYFNENARLRKELGIGADEFYHYDTPLTIDNQVHILYKAGFREVKMTFRQGNTTMLAARKKSI